jgi:hypothetical protein
MTVPIDHFIVVFTDGTVKRIDVGEGNGFYREEAFVGDNASFTTYECFITKGTSRDIPSFRKPETTTSTGD